MRDHWGWLLTGLVVLAMGPALLAPLWPDLAPAGHDLVLTFGPKAEYAAASFPALPLWHPGIYAGHPFAGNPQSMAFYPPLWIVHALGWSLPLAAVVTALHVLLAGLTCRSLCLRLGATAPGAALGGLAWALGGQSLGRIFAGHLSWSCALPWLPLLLLGLHGAVRRGSRADGIKAGLAMGLLALCGAPQAAAYAGATALLFLVCLVAGGGRASGWVRALAAAGLVAGPLVAAQALVTLPILGAIQPPPAEAWEHAVSGSMAWAGLRYLVWPPPFDAAVHLGGYGWEHTGYVGWIGLGLALGALLRRPRRGTLFFGLLALGATLFALGDNTPLFGLCYHLPLVGTFRTPGRMMAIAALALCVLAALGTPPQRERGSGRGLPALALLGLLLFHAGDLVLLHGREALSPTALQAPPAAQTAAVDRVLAALPEGARRHYRIDHPDLGALGLFGRLDRAGLLSTRGNYDPGVSWRYRKVLTALDAFLETDPRQAQHLLDLLAVRWRFAESNNALPGREKATRLSEDAWFIERSDVPAPWRWVPEAIGKRDHDALLLAQLGPTPHDPRRQVTLLAGRAHPPAAKAEGSVRCLVGNADRRTFQVECHGPGYLVLSEQHLPGWQARIDGHPVSLLRADGLFMAVRIDAPGKHRIDLVYALWGAGAGRWLVVLTAAGALLALAYFQGRKSTNPSSPTSAMPARS